MCEMWVLLKSNNKYAISWKVAGNSSSAKTEQSFLITAPWLFVLLQNSAKTNRPNYVKLSLEEGVLCSALELFVYISALIKYISALIKSWHHNCLKPKLLGHRYYVSIHRTTQDVDVILEITFMRGWNWTKMLYSDLRTICVCYQVIIYWYKIWSH